MRATTLAAGGLACAGAAILIAAFAGGGSETAPEQTRGGAGAPARTEDPTRGREVFIAQGCGSCHVFAAAGTSGPLGPDLDSALEGDSRDDVLRSIMLPNAESAPSSSTGMMPDDYAQRIAPDDLGPLVDFLLSD